MTSDAGLETAIESAARVASAVGLLALLGLCSGARAEGAVEASATLPLARVLELYREHAEDPEPPRPPVDAVVERLDIRGRVLEDSLDLDASLSVEVLAEEGWTTVPLLTLGGATYVEQVPRLDGATLATVDGELHLIARRAGRYDFTVALASVASAEGAMREASVSFPGATLARCRLAYDPALFELAGESGIVEGEAVVLEPRDNRFRIAWRHRTAGMQAAGTTTAAPEAEPVIPSAHASIVSTLEGEHILRAAYRLRFAGRKPITFELPAGHTLVRAYLNGRPIAPRVEAQTAAFEVFAARAGQAGGELELVLSASDRAYLLSGRLPLALPRPSWRTNELRLSAHLPAVFDYRWTSGTLSPMDAPVDASPAIAYVHDIPTPGKQLHFRQFLVHRTTPTLTLDYTVALDGHYFEGTR